jgi:hypothetical protein
LQDIHRRFQITRKEDESNGVGANRKPRGSSLERIQTSTSDLEISRARLSRAKPTSDIIIQMMQNLHQSGRLCLQNMTIRKLSRHLYERYEITSDYVGQEIIRISAKKILAGLSTEWAASPIYQKLEEVLSKRKKGLTDSQKDAKKIVLVPRNVPNEAEDDDPQETATDSDATRVRRRKRPSPMFVDAESPSVDIPNSPPLELTSNSYASKGKGKSVPTVAGLTSRLRGLRTRPRGSLLGEEDTEAEPRSTEDEHPTYNRQSPEIEAPRRSRRSGKGASLRLIRSSPLHNEAIPFSIEDDEDEKMEDELDEEDEIGEDPKHPRKRQKLSPSSSSDSDVEMDEAETRAMSYLSDLTAKPELKLALVSRPLPTTEPHGPRGLWTCQRDDCNFEVAGADKPRGREGVQSHLLEHADEIAARESLVLQESRGRLPIDHLLEKIRSLGEAKRLEEQRVLGGKIVPPGVKRRLAI